MPVDHIRYDLLAQEALRSVVRRVLADVARDSLPGDHHFYISFDTRAPGVRLSDRMREKYPEEMTIVLQHQFWDLVVTDTWFEVGLSFGGVPEKLVVPFSALKGFFDPSVKFGLQFELASDEVDEDEDEPDEVEAPIVRGGDVVTALPGANRPARGAGSEPEVTGGVPVAEGASAEAEAATPAPAEPAASDDGAKVVQLDVFRNKK